MSTVLSDKWQVGHAETRVRWPVIYVEGENYDGGRKEIAEIPIYVAENLNSGISSEPKWEPLDEAPVAEAVARLMASAPALLKALEKLWDAIANRRDKSQEWVTDAIADAQRDAIAACAAARGEDQV